MITDTVITVLAAGPPTSPQTLPVEATSWFTLVLSWTLYVVIAVAMLATIIFGASIVLDKKRGESGMPESDHIRALRLAVGVMIAASATEIALWFI
ncbi:hypothetical protein [Corynebacterium sp. A21]|uniref:hypothetical protein n=1 Tax=Corynebacterium sp. A21 TaxID=3457318 RepID=UPI003FD4F6EA